jgi:predicted lipoprotein with Yx(FWY)xxD motif
MRSRKNSLLARQRFALRIDREAQDPICEERLSLQERATTRARNDGRWPATGWAQAAIFLLALVAATSAAAGAGAATSPTTGSAAAPVVKSGPTSALGSILVNASGHTLYLFTSDRGGDSTCYGACAKAWPPVLVGANGQAVGGAQAKLVGRTQRKDGSFQLTYGNHPLYLFKLDVRASQLNGQDRSAFGGKWYVLSPTGLIIKKALPKTPATTTSSTTTRPTTTPSKPTTTPSRPTTFPLGDPTAGASVFVSAGCGACHIVSAAGSTGTAGPNLDALKPSLIAVENQVYSGGDHMPAFASSLTTQQIANVAAYVAQSTAQAA